MMLDAFGVYSLNPNGVKHHSPAIIGGMINRIVN